MTSYIYTFLCYDSSRVFAMDGNGSIHDFGQHSIYRTSSPIHHTDRGGQYAATEYRKILFRAGIKQSMSRAGNCYDNASMESCFGTIKTELEMTTYQPLKQASQEIQEYINYYNSFRRHLRELGVGNRFRPPGHFLLMDAYRYPEFVFHRPLSIVFWLQRATR